MKKHITSVVLALVSIVLATLLVQSNSRISELEKELGASNAVKTAVQVEMPTSEVASAPKDETPIIEPVVAAAVSETVVADEPPDKETSRRMMRNISAMMENPTMNKMMEASQRGAFGALYGDLFEHLDFTDEESEHFMDLLMVRQMSQMELGMKMMSGDLSEEDQKAMTEEIKATAEEVKEEMQLFLNNDEDYAEYEFYEQTIGERMMLSQMDDSLGDDPISDESYNSLLEMMHDEKKNFKHSGPDMMDNSGENLSPETFSEDNINNMLSDMDRLNEIMIVRAREILTPLQQAEYEKTIKQFTEMQKSQMEMAAGMFGNKK